MMKTSKKKITKNIKDLQKEISLYNIPTKVADIMERLVIKDSFEFTGHGTDFTTGEEDFSLSKCLDKKQNTSIEVYFSRKKLVAAYITNSVECSSLKLTSKVIESLLDSLYELNEHI